MYFLECKVCLPLENGSCEAICLASDEKLCASIRFRKSTQLAHSLAQEHIWSLRFESISGCLIEVCKSPSLYMISGSQLIHNSPKHPPSKQYYRQLFVSGINFVGITGKWVTWLPETIYGELISMGLPESLAGSQCSVRICELVMNKDYRKYW